MFTNMDVCVRMCIRPPVSLALNLYTHLYRRFYFNECSAYCNTNPTHDCIKWGGVRKVSNISTAGSLQHLVIALDINMITV